MSESLYIPPGNGPKSKCAFNWDIYKNRKSALQHLRKQLTLVDIILETEDGQCQEPVHSQIISAFGDKLTDFINNNGIEIDKSEAQLISRSWTKASKENPTALKGLFGHSSDEGQSRQPRTDDTGAETRAPVADVVLPNLYEKTPGRLKLVRLPKVNKYTLTVLIECAYTGYVRTDLPSGGIWQVLEVADYYEMSEVIRACCSFLDRNLNRQNCIHFYQIGCKHKHPLQRNAWHHIRANFKHILQENLSRSNRDVLENGVLGPNWSKSLRSAQKQAQVQDLLLAQRNQQPQHSLGQSSDASGPLAASSRLGRDNLDNHVNTTGRPPDRAARQEMTSSVERANGRPELGQSPSGALDGGGGIIEQQRFECNLASIKFEHFEPLLLNDKLNIDNEESVWYAIKLWCNHNLAERSKFVGQLLACMRFPRFRQGTEFSSRQIWRDPLIINNREAQHQLALLDRNHRELLSSRQANFSRDGYSLPCSMEPRQLRPRVPHSVLLAIGGWQQGQPTKLIESYDFNCNMWFECKRKILTQLAYHGIENINNLLYICGGTDGNEILNELFVFNPILGECHQKASMREARCYVSTAHLNGFLYAMGGHNGIQRMRSVERFDLKNELWLRCPDMNVARSDASACVYESLIFIAGGLNDQVIESSVEFYNCQDQSWTFIQSMQTPRTSFTLINYRHNLFAIGGNNGQERLNSVELYDFRTRQWSAHSQMRHKRSTFSAALLDESKLFVVGGYNGQTPFNQVEMFDRESAGATWQTMQRIRYDRSGLKVVVIKDLPNAIDYTFLGATSRQMLAGPSPLALGSLPVGGPQQQQMRVSSRGRPSDRSSGLATGVPNSRSASSLGSANTNLDNQDDNTS